MDEKVLREELEAALETRRELGDEMEPAVVDAFVERIERRLAERARGMALGIPLLLVAAIFTGLPGVIAVCVALVAIAAFTTR